MQFEHGFTLVDLVEPNALRDVCVAFHGLFGISTRVFGKDGALLADAAGEDALCGYLRGFADGRRRCNDFRVELKKLDPGTASGETLQCFSGCNYRVVPVLYEGEPMGKVVYGPFIPAELDSLPSGLLDIDPAVEGSRITDSAAALRRIPAGTLDRIVNAFLGVLDLIMHSGYRATMISEAHIMAVQESYREITEKNKTLTATTERLKEMDRLKSNFLAAVSHELRTPLTSIIGYSEMLSQGLGGPLSDEQKQFVSTILEKGEHLLSLISSVLDLATLDAGRLAMHRVPTDLEEVCRHAVEKVRAQTPRKDVTIEIGMPNPVPPVRGDPDLIEKAVAHLIDNALKFSPPAGTVSIDIRAVDPQPERESVGFVLVAPLRRFVAISVADSGPGIPEAERERIFEAFYQVDGSETRTHGGLGLGLALVRQFAQAHDGRVEVDGAPGKGSVFRLLLPVPPGA